MKIKSLGKSFGIAVQINQYGKSCNETLCDEQFETVISKFNKKKWESIVKNIVNQAISFHSRKKRDLGVDSLLLKVVGNKYIIATHLFSNSQKTEKEYFEIIL